MERGVHRIDEVLTDSWLEEFIARGLAAVEAYLSKHAAFDAFLEGRD